MFAKRNAKWVHAHASIWACDGQICVNYKKTKKMTTRFYLTMKQIMTTNRKAIIEKSRFLLIFLNFPNNNKTIGINILLL